MRQNKTRVMRLPFAVVGIAILLGFGAPGPGGPIQGAAAQEIQRIAAIVNDDVISMYDLIARLDMVVATSRLPDTPETRRRLVPQVLRALIDEQLQIQEARRLNLKVSERELAAAVTALEKRNGVQPGKFSEFLAKRGIRLSTVKSQLKASFAWNKVVSQRIRPRIRIADEEVDEVLQRISRNQGSQQYRLREIFLAIESPDQDVTVKETAERLVKQIRDGADFAVLANQFSQSDTAGAGGDMGWVQRGQLDEKLDGALVALAPGQLSDPVKTLAGYYILLLQDRRTLAAKSADELSVSLHHVKFPAPEGATPDDIIAQKELAETISETAQGCTDMANLIVELGIGDKTAKPTRMKIKDVPEYLRDAALNLEPGTPSAPITTKEGFSVVMVCQRDTRANLPARDEIRTLLARERQNVMVRRYIRDLRLAAFLEVRV